MSIRILTKDSIDNTNIDGARQNHFSSGMKSGIVKGAFNEGNFFASASNIIALDTCELRISGHRVIIDTTQYLTLTNKPASDTNYSMIAQISIDDLSVPTFSLFIQPKNTILIQDNLFKSEKGSGLYQIKIGDFTLDTNGEIKDVKKVAKLITGGTEEKYYGTTTYVDNVATDLYFDSDPQEQIDNINNTLGDISNLLDSINGEVV